MRDRDLYAVVTGDIVGSSKPKVSQRSHLLSVLKSSFATIEDILPGEIFAPCYALDAREVGQLKSYVADMND